MSDRKTIVIKSYPKRSRKTGRLLSPKRAIIERHTAKFLEKFIQKEKLRSISAMKVLGHNRSSNIFSLVDGNCLRDLSAEKWPDRMVFHELGVLLSKFENDRSDGLNGLRIAAQRLGALVRKHKTSSTSMSKGCCNHLGDLTLANLISANGKVYVLDLEFAHKGSPGYDIGSLLAELNHYPSANHTHRMSAHAVLQGYLEAGGRKVHALTWRKKFSLYFKEKYRGVA